MNKLKYYLLRQCKNYSPGVSSLRVVEARKRGLYLVQAMRKNNQKEYKNDA